LWLDEQQLDRSRNLALTGEQPPEGEHRAGELPPTARDRRDDP
jgi:hypothetical protein